MFKVYSSSAGSGKTYTLTKEYLKLALHSSSETYFRQILAVTFTNAAANEMKERILLMLRTFSVWTPESDAIPPMLRDVATELYPEAVEDQEGVSGVCQLIAIRAQLVFREILHRYSDFSVMTIDKFTQRIVSSFTDELGIPFSFETQLDSDLLEEAVDRVLSRIGQEGEEILTEIVEKYYKEKADEGQSWSSLPMQIRETSETILNETSYIKMLRIADMQMEDWIAVREQLKKFVKNREEGIQQLGQQAYTLIEQAFLIDKDFHQSGRGIYGYFKHRNEGAKLWDDPNSYVVKTIEEDQWYGGKTALPVKEKIDSLKPELEHLYAEIEKIRANDSARVMLFQLLDRHLYNLSLLGEIRKEFDTLLRQNNQVHISDFNRKIMEIVAREPVPFVFERLGEKYNHILVDEFQDTSKLQFANLLPLIENTLSSGHFNLIVGDAKQSIYRFRGGDMDLILHLAQDKVLDLAGMLGEGKFHLERLNAVSANLKVDHLRTNRRSYSEITSFNNEFFGFVSEMLSETSQLVGDVYDAHFRQEIPEGVREGGHVQLEFLEMSNQIDDEDDQAADPICLRTLELIEEHRSAGYAWRDIAILCKRKKEASALANALKERGYPLISDDALSLGYSRSVRFLVSFMKVLQTPDNRLARYEAAYLFHQIIRHENPDAAEHAALRDLCAEQGLDTFLGYFKRWDIQLTAFRLRQLTVFELSESLMQAFGLFENLTENQYLFRFLDIVLEFGTRRTNHLGDFLTHWDTARHKLSITIPAETDAIRITTIHKSKGLEYPVVIVPYAHWRVTPDARLGRLWVDLDSLNYDELKVPGGQRLLNTSMVSIQKQLENTEIAHQYTEEKNRTLVENVNLLYVAFTRPVQRLFVLAQNEKNWVGDGRINLWLQRFLEAPGSTVPWEVGRSVYAWAVGFGGPFHAHVKTDAEQMVVTHIATNDRTDRLRLRRLAERIFDTETFELRHDRLQKMKYFLGRLKAIEDSQVLVDSMAREGIWTKTEGQTISDQALAFINRSDLGDLYQKTLLVQVNREMLVPGGKMLHVDRLAEETGGSSVFMAFVGGSNGDAQKKHLGKLMKAYRDTGLDAKGLLVTLENEELEWV